MLLRPASSGLASCASTASLSSVATSTTAVATSATGATGLAALNRASSAAASATSLSRNTSGASLVSGAGGLPMAQRLPPPPQQQQPKPRPNRQQQTAGARDAAAGAAVTVDLIIPLDPPVAGISALHVVAVQAQQLAPKHVSWLAAGWACVPKDAAVEALAEALNLGDGAAAATTGGAAASSSGTAGKGGKTFGKGKAAAAAANRRAVAAAAAPKLWPLPKVLGFDTEFVRDQLAVVQLCAGPHVLLVQVPSCRQPASEQQQQQTKEKAQGGKEQPPWRAPFTLLPELKALLCNPCIPKAAAEAWQDALMVYMGFGVKLRGGLDLTVAVPPDHVDLKRGRDKLGLFDIFRTFFAAADHVQKDKTINHTKWLSSRLDDKQKRYAALDAFVSYAAGVCVLLRPGKAPPLPVDLAAAPEWEVRLAAQWVAVQQYLEAQSPDRTKHDFYRAWFSTTKKGGVVMEVRMSRYNTRLRLRCWAEATLPNGRRVNGRCNMARGRSAHVVKLRWSDTKQNVASLSELPDTVTRIEMTDSSDTPEEAGIKALLPKVLCGAERMRGRPLLEGVFGGGDFSFPAAGPGGANDGAAAAAASASPAATGAAGGGGKKAKGKGKAQEDSTSGGAAVGSATAAAKAASHAVAAVRWLANMAGVNASQARALSEILRGACRTGQHGSATDGSAVQLVQGPPGTGKTTVISHAVRIWLEEAAPRLPLLHKHGGAGSGARLLPAVACVARSNVAAKNIALSLIKRGLGPKDFRLIVSQEFHFEWHEEQYRGELEAVLLLSSELKGADMQRALLEVKVYVTTVSMLANPSFKGTALHGKALSWLVVDEASQICGSDLQLPLYQYGHHLTCLSLFGDDMQLPPFGSEWGGAQIRSIFDQLSSGGGGGGGAAQQRLREQPAGAFHVGPPLCPPAAGGARDVAATGAAATSPVVRLMLDVSYRLPRDLCAFISREMYGGRLQSGRRTGSGGAAGDAFPAHVLWLNVEGEEDRSGGSSCSNPVEARRAVRLVQERYLSTSWTILTGYDLQRSVLEREVLRCGLGRHPQHNQPTQPAGTAAGGGGGSGGGGGGGGDKGPQGSDRVYNIDTFQGREDEVVVVSLTRVKALGFMDDDRRVNVMLTRCTQQLAVVGSLRLALQHPHTLIGRMAEYCILNGRVEQ
eukprot:XP_001701078.1 predicted protein [Chlamydomonas reinhardtii]